MEESLIHMLQAALAVMSRQANAYSLLQQWEMRLKGIDPLELLLIEAGGTRPLDNVLIFSEAERGRQIAQGQALRSKAEILKSKADKLLQGER